MRWPVPHSHNVVAAWLILGLSLPGPTLGQSALPEGQPPVIPESPLAQNDLRAQPALPSEPTVQAQAQTRAELDALFAELGQPQGETWSRAESDILRLWSRSGSAAMDLLYKRGEAALDAGDTVTAIGHLTALTDHAPDFAAGWHLRAVALYMDGDLGPALADLQQALRIEPRHFPALTQLGAILDELGQRQAALRALRASLKIHPHQQDARDAVTRLEQELQGTDA